MSWKRTGGYNRGGQFKSPGQGIGGRGGGKFGRQPSYSQGYPYSPGFSARSPMPMGHRGSDSGEGYYQGDESYEYQQGASDDSRDAQFTGDMSQHQLGFGSEYGDGSSQQGYDQADDPQNYAAHVKTQPGESAPGAGQEGTGGGGKSPPDIKYEVTPVPSVPFMKADDFELIEIDPDEEDEL